MRLVLDLLGRLASSEKPIDRHVKIIGAIAPTGLMSRRLRPEYSLPDGLARARADAPARMPGRRLVPLDCRP